MTVEQSRTTKLPTDCCELGEGPGYDRETDTAWWCDIVGKALHEYRFDTGVALVHALPRMASYAARVDAGRQLLAMDDGLYLRTVAGGSLTRLVAMEADNPDTRSNDGRVHPSGRLWIGTMGRKSEWQAGTIYCYDGQVLKPMFRNVTIPNSICFSADGKTGYFADTAVNTVWRVPLDAKTALPIGEPETFLTEKDLPFGGYFDGSATDADDVLWNAAWGGGSVSGFSPSGELLRSFEIPAAQSSCPCFVGPNLDRMLVTTAWQGYSEAARAADPGAGFTYVIDGGFRGKADPAFRLG
ncbi:SMP-30/gluconolactonase/LRE family protein [Rhodospirillaceae bacterium KN72]|uniref:SMP-30/gluconolactonase/LRE family protein n=1 Tax=Pacificispira spongiicola TaxID=2729598 RepID=A0A7Y0DXY7_9PROT|nr:SMP-30/gluconolactonase/LRE family protein [Pacificispira spongiicola]NMM43667.1 SMP-30/gluconolactonase/LRE family protein [Pacificispira spongiicola]